MTTAVIAEDEALLREELVSLLRGAWPELDIKEACGDGGSALDAIAAHRPDVAWLDIRMPGLTGLEVAAAAAVVSPGTQVVFVTAYNQYAVDAFERGAIDYLLKPVTAERLAATVQRLKSRLGGSPAGTAGLAAIVEHLRALLPATTDTPPLTWITASVGRETRLIGIEDVAYFRSDNKYTLVMTAEGEALIRKPLRELLEVLDRTTFRQIHRSVIVNMKAIAAITKDETGRGTIRLKHRPETLPVSIAFMSLFRTM